MFITTTIQANSLKTFAVLWESNRRNQNHDPHEREGVEGVGLRKLHPTFLECALIRYCQAKKYIGCFVDTYCAGMGKPVKYDQGICIGSFEVERTNCVGIDRYAPRFTTDPAAAMAVLKKCTEKDLIQIVQLADETWSVCGWTRKNNPSEAATLELAVCLFARQLFKKT